MRKKMFCLVLLVGLLISGTMTAYAKDAADAGSDEVNAGKWNVTFTEAGKMQDNLGGSNAINDELSTMQPGDKITVSVSLSNSYNDTTYWYMKNTIINSLEEADGLGGAYGYKLVYVDPTKPEPQVLFASEKVGGEGSAGLEDLEKNGRLNDYFYLGGLEKGQSAKVMLTVELDGETQGNSYQDKVANLSMNFAVEPQPTRSGSVNTHHQTITREVINDEVVYVDEDGVPLAQTTDIVKTSDDMKMFPYVLAACISGSLLMLFVLLGLKDRRKEEEGGAVR